MVSTDHGEHWLRVDDSGIGMSRRVLTDFLLNFGASFWGSREMQEELPGLLSSGVMPTGKYGIGFFSVFMIATQVQVVTRRSDAAAKDTLVLEFSGGVEGRPILRFADRSEQLIDGGTTVKLRLLNNPVEEGGILCCGHLKHPLSLEDLCRRLCPAIDVDLFIRKGDRLDRVIGAEDWKTIEPVEFLARLEPQSPGRNGDFDIGEVEAFCRRVSPNLRELRSNEGEVVGRACIAVGFPGENEWDSYSLLGTVTVGGLRATQSSGIVGILKGASLRASRDIATPIVTHTELARWATEQAQILPEIYDDPTALNRCATFVRICSGSTLGLPVARHGNAWVTEDQVIEITKRLEMVILINEFSVRYQFKNVESFELDDTVIVAGSGGIPAILRTASRLDFRWPWGRSGDRWEDSFIKFTLGGLVIEAVCKAWECSIDVLMSINDLEHEGDVPVGHAGERVIRTHALKIVKPTARTDVRG
jgi:hypothetical protein